jgi:hypothetical protein
MRNTTGSRHRLTITSDVVAVTLASALAAFGPDGSSSNPAVPLFQQIAAALAPDHAPPSSSS